MLIRLNKDTNTFITIDFEILYTENNITGSELDSIGIN